ncbi:helix-turn-helix transcriptional regulator [Microbacterium telephonicum]|uniref:DNA-binding XRE family transcriptional regulator n=1 Tax=Microbacterium telephonicum TaxID=1714841 RepID=A0A498C478_9MICO|nr:helix-turn-helix transcriptional regulator [Microbacterium telephonicum]RLK49326.1 DNA-binding XRE family transcriptional regulator [Microbacterium telephonicum]
MVRRRFEHAEGWREYAVQLGLNLQAVRVERGLSQEDVAYRARLTRFTYQKYEKGESKPGEPTNLTIRTLLALTQVLEVSLEDLLPDDVPDLLLR